MVQEGVGGYEGCGFIEADVCSRDGMKCAEGAAMLTCAEGGRGMGRGGDGCKT